MQRRKRPVRWQLDLFIGLMIGSLLVLLWAELPERWYAIIGWAWIVVTWCGMAVWVWIYRHGLREEDQRRRRKGRQHGPVLAQPTASRSPALTPVQQHFLDVMDSKRWYEH